jgi:ferredoxin/nitrate reductase gamma subunit
MISSIIFVLMLALGGGIFFQKARKIRRNILLGRNENRTDQPARRWATMGRVAMGQSKMAVRPIAGFFHILIYVGFVLINIEVLEIVIDGILGTHRIFQPLLGNFYKVVIGFFEILGVGVILACVVFLWRRNIQPVARFKSPEMTGWPSLDANLILIIEIVLMGALLLMNTAEANMEGRNGYAISNLLAPLLSGVSESGLHSIERVSWWLHIAGILAFLNYLPYSKHFHIILAFPNTWYAQLEPAGQMNNMESVKREVEMMLDPNANPYAAPAADAPEPERFGAKDVSDLSWKSLLDAYSCTECGRCTSVCPANNTGKLLSPRKIMMDTRDRLEEVGNNIDKNGSFVDDGKALLRRLHQCRRNSGLHQL